MKKEIVEGPFHPALGVSRKGPIYKDLIVEYF